MPCAKNKSWDIDKQPIIGNEGEKCTYLINSKNDLRVLNFFTDPKNAEKLQEWYLKNKMAGKYPIHPQEEFIKIDFLENKKVVKSFLLQPMICPESSIYNKVNELSAEMSWK
jgi:hypothetical protein